ncbi:hypothetical protein HHI36_020110 [Cryptolaemus montrouzieri]|uniref:Uncharacterized protein n=1 Tax=Cryptolaemus montrouzieri TaxID=559131 RepID=A0ABD2N9I2_9CUCU
MRHFKVQGHATASGGCLVFQEKLQQARNAEAERSNQSRDSAVSKPRQPTKDKHRTKSRKRATYEEAQTEEHARESSSVKRKKWRLRVISKWTMPSYIQVNVGRARTAQDLFYRDMETTRAEIGIVRKPNINLAFGDRWLLDTFKCVGIYVNNSNVTVEGVQRKVGCV